MMKESFLAFAPSFFGKCTIIWCPSEDGPRVRRILIPRGSRAARSDARATLGGRIPRSCSTINELSERIQGFLKGKAVEFETGILLLEECSEFQQSVLLAERTIPRGRVCSYGRIARRLGVPQSARAVGRALATNPFPIVIPCHRAVRNDGRIGGYQGGQSMKRRLLEFEGIEFDSRGRVPMARFAP